MRYLTDQHISTIVSTVAERFLRDEVQATLKLMTPVVYIAASWQNRFKLRTIRNRFNSIGVAVSSQWIDFDREYTDGDFGAEADRDYGDIEASNYLILDTTDTATKGGREWEAGYATGIGLHILRVGPVITPFHARVNRSFEDWGACISWFATAMEHADVRDN